MMRYRTGSTTTRACAALLTGLLLVTSACDPTDPDREPESVASIEKVERRDLAEVFQLGGIEAAEHEAFAREPRIAVRADGTLFALDQSANTVWRYDADGTFSGTFFGGTGEGPGEFTFAGDIGFVDDTLWVRNLSLPFVSLFSDDGKFLRRYTEEGELVIGRTGIPDGPEAMLVNGAQLRVEVVPLGSSREPREVPLMIATASGAVDTIGVQRDPPGAYAPGVGTLRGRPGALPPLRVVEPGGTAVLTVDWDDADSGAVVVRRFVPGGAATTDTLEFPPVPLSVSTVDSLVTAESDSVRARLGRARERLGPELGPQIPDDLDQKVRDALRLGTTMPLIRAVVAGIDGSLWVERTLGVDRYEWVAFDSARRPVARVQLPPGHTLRAASLESLWTTHTDTLDVPYLTRFDLIANRP